MNFQNEIPFQEPPRTFRGMLILETDDGFIGDYTHWYPLLKSKKQLSQWYPFEYKVSASSVMNSSGFGKEGHVTLEHLHEMVEEGGWEVINHGRYGAGLNTYNVNADANAGDTVLSLKFTNAMLTRYDYVIKGRGGIQEKLDIKGFRESKYVDLNTPLQHSYDTTAVIELTPEEMQEEINGGLQDLLDLGFDVKHFVNSNHYWAYNSNRIIKERHLSTRNDNGTSTTVVTNHPPVDPYRLNGNLDGYANHNRIRQLVDKLYEEDSFGIWYGHGFKYGKGSNLDYLVDYAIEKGVKIVSRHEAYVEKVLPLL